MDHFEDITKRMHAVYEAKNHDYGNSFSEIYSELGFDYAYGKMKEKINRIRTLRKETAQVKGEPLKDSIMDLANYAILTLIEIEERESILDNV